MSDELSAEEGFNKKGSFTTCPIPIRGYRPF